MTEKTEGTVRPETFYDIQDDASWAILRLLPILTGFYSICVGLIILIALAASSPDLIFKIDTAIWWYIFYAGCGVGVFVTLIHFVAASKKSIDRVIDRTGARQLDSEDHYHRSFKNIVQELSVASPVSRIKVRVIPSHRTNLLSAGNRTEATIIATEGALGKLRRDELQAVVAHEIAHIAYGDSRLKFFTSNLLQTFELAGSQYERNSNYDTSLSQHSRGQQIIAHFAVAVTATILEVFNRFLVTGLSQERTR